MVLKMIYGKEVTLLNILCMLEIFQEFGVWLIVE